MRHASLFSGIGGFDLAADWMGWENVFHCDINPFGKKVLEYYYPNSISYGDITKTDFSIHRGEIDILTGGFPCQPYSLAGKRKGKEDERHLWPQMLRAIREISPRWVVGENVYGLVSWDGGLVFHEVQSDLEAEGYEVFPYVLPACAINAPHRRDRVFFVAYSNNASTEYSIQARRNVPASKDDARTSTDSDCIRCGRRDKQSETNQSKEWKIHKNEQQYRNRVWSETKRCSNSSSDSECKRLEGQCWEWQRCSIDRSNERLFIGSKNKFVTTDSERFRLEHSKKTGNIREGKGKTQSERSESSSTIETICNNGYATDTKSERFESFETRSAEFQSSERQRLYGRSSNGQSRRWENFPTVSPICDGNDGISDRLDSITFSKWRKQSIMAGGNAVVPQLIYVLFKTISKFEELKTKQC